MTRSSPSVQRFAAILDFFAGHPDASFTLTDLVRALKFSRATCHGLLTGLVDAGYLFRLGDKSYVLGPALLKIGRMAHNLLSPLQAAQPEMRAIADEYDVVCSAVYREGDALIVRERAAARSHIGWSAPRDTHLPLRPPYAGPFFAWSQPDLTDAWMAALQPPADESQRAVMRQSMAYTRSTGYSVVVRGPSDTAVHVIDLAFTPPGGDEPGVPTDGDDPQARFTIRSITAPVFGADRDVTFVLSLVGFIDPLGRDDIRTIGNRLRTACDRITAYTGGRKPLAEALA